MKLRNVLGTVLAVGGNIAVAVGSKYAGQLGAKAPVVTIGGSVAAMVGAAIREAPGGGEGNNATGKAMAVAGTAGVLGVSMDVDPSVALTSNVGPYLATGFSLLSSIGGWIHRPILKR